MNRPLHVLVCTGLIAALSSTSALADATKPVRHLTYAFDISITTDRAVHSSGVGEAGGGTGSGVTHYGGGNSDKGTINVDVMGVQPDTGLVVNISEQGRGDRTAEVTTCVVYGTGSVICDSSKRVNQEEMTLLRVLGRNFVNPSLMDGKRHWQNGGSMPGGSETNDYTIVRDDNNGMLAINYVRVLKVEGAQGFRADTNGQMTYNQKMSVPTQVKEDTVTRQQLGGGQDDRTEQQLTLTLTMDSLAQAATTP